MQDKELKKLMDFIDDHMISIAYRLASQDKELEAMGRKLDSLEGDAEEIRGLVRELAELVDAPLNA